MKLDIPYGQASMKLVLSDNRPVEVVSPLATSPDQGSIERSLSHPAGSPDLTSFLSKRRRILVVVNDHTRPTPTAAVLKRLDLKEKQVTTIIASGAHRPPSQRELEALLGGAGAPYGGEVTVHDSKDKSQLRSIGRTSRGTELQFNKRLFETDGIIVIGSVEPHYFAGFTGGRKFLLPALAGFRSIEMNHSFALDDQSSVLKLEGNPVHEDIMEALKRFNRFDDIFSIQLVLNADHEVSYTLSGDIVRSFASAVDRAKEVYVPRVDAKADIVVAVATPPMDMDLFQSHKAIENVRLALKDQGVLILVSPCNDGIGSREFYDLLNSGRDVLSIIKKGYKLGYHKAAKLLQLQEKAKLLAVSSLPQDKLRTINITPHVDIQTAVDEATKLRGSDSRILIVLDACLTVPFPEN